MEGFLCHKEPSFIEPFSAMITLGTFLVISCGFGMYGLCKRSHCNLFLYCTTLSMLGLGLFWLSIICFSAAKNDTNATCQQCQCYGSNFDHLAANTQLNNIFLEAPELNDIGTSCLVTTALLAFSIYGCIKLMGHLYTVTTFLKVGVTGSHPSCRLLACRACSRSLAPPPPSRLPP